MVGSFEPDDGVMEEDDLCVVGVLLAYGLGVVRLKGLK
jgi:hypothetical protein